MKVIYATDRETLPVCMPSIFLAGPTVRGGSVGSGWRPTALEILKMNEYKGAVLYPEPKGEWHYERQLAWEKASLESATVILFWVPRSLSMPGFTTNIEWGKWYDSGKVVLGYPKGTEKMRYLDYDAKDVGAPVFHELAYTCDGAVKLAKELINAQHA